MENNQIKTIINYLKKKYPDRYSLTLKDLSREFLMSKDQIKELINEEKLYSKNIKTVASFIVRNPPSSNKIY